MEQQIITLDEAKLILGAARNQLEALFIMLLWHTGGRSTEVSHIKPENINLGVGYIVLMNLKQNKVYQGKVIKKRRPEYKPVYVKRDVIVALVEYIAENKIKPDEYIFSYNGVDPWTKWNNWNIITRASARAKVFKLNRYGKIVPAWPHCFRHGAGTHQFEMTKDIVFVQEQLGHANLETTRGYIQVSQKSKQGYVDRMEDIAT